MRLPCRHLLLASVLVAAPAWLCAAAAAVEGPANAATNAYGRWECNSGFRRVDNGCVAVRVPENAYASGASNDRGWECRYGFREDREHCEEIKVPQNAFLSLSSYDSGWECQRGFQQKGARCIAILLPENAYLSGSNYDRGWECKRGYRAAGATCAAIKVPANAYLTESAHGSGWACERGFAPAGDISCRPITVPVNGFLDGPGRVQCERGFRISGANCLAISLPAHAHLDRRGWDWACDRPYRQHGDECAAP
jgi:hypothetical protein